MIRPSSIPLAILLALGTATTVLAQSQRYPTTQEMQGVLRQFKRDLPNIQQSRSYQDRRSQTQKQQIGSFAKAWSAVNPTVSPFLGEWTAIEETTAIYPSRTKGRVCIISSSVEGYEFTVGTIQNRHILTNKNTILARENNFLVSAFIYQGKPLHYQYANPKPLRHPSQTIQSSQKQQIVKKFNQANCTVDAPSLKASLDRLFSLTSITPAIPTCPKSAIKPNTITWQQHIDTGATGGGAYSKYIQVDFDLPQEFRRGYIYRIEGANTLWLYILKEGLPSYPPVLSSKSQQIDQEKAVPYLRAGKALVLQWQFSGSDQRYSNPSVHFPKQGTGCLGRVCLTAPFMSHSRISSILRSERAIARGMRN